MKKISRHFSSLLLLLLAATMALPLSAQSRQEREQMQQRRLERIAAKSANANNRVPMTPIRRAGASSTVLYGSVFSSWGSYWTAPAIYAYDAYDANTLIEVKGGVRVYGGATFGDGLYYAQNFEEVGDGKLVLPVTLTVYNPNTAWSKQDTYYGYWFTEIASDLTWDPTQKVIYGVFWDSEYTSINQFGYITLNDPQETAYKANIISTMPERIAAIAADKAGVIYAFGKSGKLYTVDKVTGEASLVGDTGLEIVPWYQSACFDEASGHLFWHTYAKAYDEWGDKYPMWRTYEVDPATAEATLTADFCNNDEYSDDQILGLTTLRDFTVSTYAPALVTNVTPSFVPGNLSGTIKFTLPTTNAAGAALSGNLRYTVYMDGTKCAEGEAAAGTEVNAAVSATANGTHKVSVVCEQNGVTSRLVTAEAYIGQDVPLAPAGVTATVSEEKDEKATVTVSWTAPTMGENGPIDPSALTYVVTRMPEGATVYEGAELSCTDEVDASVRTTFHYEVKAKNGEELGAAATSADLTVGSVFGVPFHEDFENPDADMTGWLFLDGNKDRTTWIRGTAENAGTMYYKFSSKNAADDYLVLPGIKLKGGNLYHLNLALRNNYLEERVAAYVGTAPTIEGLTEEIIAPTLLPNGPASHNMTGDFLPTADGVYYFAVKCCSDADMSFLYLDEVSVTVTPETAPATPVATLTPGEKGALSATIDITVPSQALNGSALTAIDYCAVTRDGTEVKRFDNPAPGSKLTFTDSEGLTTGKHTYKVYAAANGEESSSATFTPYIGLDKPAAVRNLVAVEDLNEIGTVVLTWDAPEKGQNGGYVDPESLVYIVSYGLGGDEATTHETTFRQKIDISQGQNIQAYSVYAENSAGSGRNVWQTVVAIAGPAVVAPVVESFPGVSVKSGPWTNQMTVGRIGQARWNICDGSITEAGTQDGDGGMINFETSFIGAASQQLSPKFDISQLNKPQLSYWVYMSGKTDKLKVEISADYGEYHTLKETTLNEGVKGWRRFSIDLSEWKNSSFVRLAFHGISVESTSDIISIDNISIKEDTDFDLQAVSLSGPQKVKVGETGNFTIQLRNMGNKAVAAGDYKVALYKNEKQVSVYDGVAMAVDGTASMTLRDVPTIDDSEISVYSAAIIMDKDGNLNNNQTNVVSVEIILPQYPRVKNLRGGWSGSAMNLYWDEPDFADMPAQSVTERFESYPAFAITGYGDWKTVDVDGGKTIRMVLSGMDVPLEYEHAGEPMAFQLFNSYEAGIPFSSWDPHSGQQMLVAFRSYYPEEGVTQNDDWLISPELNGSAQTISFYAKTGMNAPYVPEEFQVLYSTTTPTVEAFKQVGETYSISNVRDWQEIKAQLPEGAKYFAIRYVSSAKYALLIDDITYIPAGAVAEDLSLLGYNVYRNGERINDEPLPESVWTDETTTLGETYTYRVTAIYDKGESLYSNELTATNTAINEVATSEVTIRTSAGRIVIEGAQGLNVAVYSMDGRCLLNQTGRTKMQIAAQKGYYVVKAGNRSTTVLVR